MSNRTISWENDPNGRSAEAGFWNFRLRVHHHIDYNPADWLMSAYELGVSMVVLPGAKTLAEAKKMAKRSLLKFLVEAAHELRRLEDDR
jgi:hypothetical protein